MKFPRLKAFFEKCLGKKFSGGKNSPGKIREATKEIDVLRKNLERVLYETNELNEHLEYIDRITMGNKEEAAKLLAKRAENRKKKKFDEWLIYDYIESGMMDWLQKEKKIAFHKFGKMDRDIEYKLWLEYKIKSIGKDER